MARNIDSIRKKRNIKRLYKHRLSILDEKVIVYTYKKKGTTYITDPDLNVLARTKKYNTQNFKEGLKDKLLVDKKGNINRTTDIKLKNIKTTRYQNFSTRESMRLIRSKEAKFGRVKVVVDFFGKNKEKVRKTGESIVRDLTIEQNVKVSFDEAFKQATAQIGFSYERYDIISTTYVYGMRSNYRARRRR